MDQRTKHRIGGLITLLITPRWWAILALGLACGLLNLYLLGYSPI